MPSSFQDVLVVASRHNREVDGVIDGLRNAGLAVGRFCPCQYPEFDSRTWRIDAPDDTYGKSRVAWLADFSGWSIEKSMTGLAREAAFAETVAFAEGALLTLDAKWLNSPDCVRIASRKILQLHRARSLGILTPPTCVTNSEVDARDFIRSVGRAIVKPIASSYMTYGAQSLKFYTREVDLQSNEVFRTLAVSPLIFQQRIDKVAEIRVTVVDEWSVAVKTNLENLDICTPVDTRQLDYSKYSARFQRCLDRPDLLIDSKRIVRNLGLSYGGVDWAVDSTGAAHFLECNPLGSFKWFEICAGESITAKLVHALSKRCT